MAIIKLINVPIKIYSVCILVFGSVSEKRINDLPAIKKPIASYWLYNTKTKIRMRSNMPIHFPASFNVSLSTAANYSGLDPK